MTGARKRGLLYSKTILKIKSCSYKKSWKSLERRCENTRARTALIRVQAPGRLRRNQFVKRMLKRERGGWEGGRAREKRNERRRGRSDRIHKRESRNEPSRISVANSAFVYDP